MNLVSSLLARSGLARILGMQFGGKRDLYEIFGYKKVLTFQDFAAKYLRQDIAKRIIDAPASATWRNPPTLQCDDDIFVQKWNEIIENFELWGQIERADRLAGLGMYSVILLGFNDSTNMRAPVRPSKNNKLLYIQPYTQLDARISEIDTDPTSERFGLPLFYIIRLNNNLDALQAMNGTTAGTNSAIPTDITVHYSRIVHIAEGLNESNFLGTPRLQPVFNLLDDLIKITGGTAETYWLASNRGMQIDVDKDAEMTQQDAEDLDAEVEEYQHELRRVLRTKAVKVVPLGGSTPDPKNAAQLIISLISGTTGIPQRVLTGSEAGQLASDQDRANWSDRIKERRITFAEPNVLNPFAKALMNAGVLPILDLSKFSYVWPPNFQLTPLEEAQTMAQKARAIINLGKSFVDGVPFITSVEARNIVGLPNQPIEGTIPPPPQVAPTGGNSTQTSSGQSTDNQPNDY